MVESLAKSMRELVARGDAEAMQSFLHALSPMETARGISRLNDEERAALLHLIDVEEAADVLEDLPDELAADILEDLTPAEAAAILHELPSDERVDVLADVDPDFAETVLAAMESGEEREVRRLMAYGEATAGGLMTTEFVAFGEMVAAGDVRRSLRLRAQEYVEYSLRYLYVVDTAGILVGVLRLRDLVIIPDDCPVREAMIEQPVAATVEMELLKLLDFFDENPFVGLPVVDAEERLIGVVLRADVEEAGAELAQETYMKSAGIIGGEELRSMPVWERIGGRLSWLGVNLCLSVLSVSVIALFEATLEQVIALGVFFPMVANVSGCSGSQAIAVSIRELAMGLAQPRDVWRVWRKEIIVGVVNGFALGIAIAVLAWVWKGNGWLGLVVGVALGMNTMIAVSLGGTIPLILKRLGRDPAMASGPILTTTTDLCAFTLVFSMAWLLLPQLVG